MQMKFLVLSSPGSPLTEWKATEKPIIHVGTVSSLFWLKLPRGDNEASKGISR